MQPQKQHIIEHWPNGKIKYEEFLVDGLRHGHPAIIGYDDSGNTTYKFNYFHGKILWDKTKTPTTFSYFKHYVVEVLSVLIVLLSVSLLFYPENNGKIENNRAKTLRKDTIQVKTRTIKTKKDKQIIAKSSTAKDYIEKFKPLAISEMKRTGIPASITLAQSLLESGFGKSELARKAHNYFGIKGRKGSYFYKKDGCYYRRYESVQESFADHSKFLKKDRYAALFELSASDYKGWAHGLKKLGYAEDPNYAEKLIKIIEKYELAELE